MMGGREIPTLTFTLAIAGAGNTMTNAKNNAPKNNFFILLSPLHITVLSILKSFLLPATSGTMPFTSATPSS
jgi:hypothetical protein